MNISCNSPQPRIDLSLTHGLLMFNSILLIAVACWVVSVEYRIQRAATIMEQGLTRFKDSLPPPPQKIKARR